MDFDIYIYNYIYMIIYVRSVQTHPVWIRRMVVMLQLKKWRRILFVISIWQSLVSKLQYVNRSRRRKRAIWRGWCTCFLFLSNGQGHSRSTHKLSSLHSRSSRRYFFWNISLPWDEVRIIKKKHISCLPFDCTSCFAEPCCHND